MLSQHFPEDLSKTMTSVHSGVWIWYLPSTRWFKYDGDSLCVHCKQSVPVIFEPPCTWDHNSNHSNAVL